MNRPPVHQSPPAPVVAELVGAGLSRSTAMAMESWKAVEVLELLRGSRRPDQVIRPVEPVRGTI